MHPTSTVMEFNEAIKRGSFMQLLNLRAAQGVRTHRDFGTNYYLHLPRGNSFLSHTTPDNSSTFNWKLLLPLM